MLRRMAIQVGSSYATVPAPFGRNSAPWVKAFNQRLFEERFEDGKSSKASKAKKANERANRASAKNSTAKFSPLEAYQKYLEKSHPPKLARALASGNTRILPGASIGERHVSRRREAATRDYSS